jgi:riboflavin biosynthesis pyrimidine reductase
MTPLTEADMGFPAQSTWRRPTWVRACMVSTLDGSAIGSDGVSGSISTPVDHENFLRLRRDCDVILVGAGTLRTEDYARTSVPIAVVSNRLDLAPGLRLFSPDLGGERPIILTTDLGAARVSPWLSAAADVVSCGDEHVELDVAIAALSDRGLLRIHCEGGPTLLGDLASADLLDEMVLSVTPELLGTPTRIMSCHTATTGMRFTGFWELDGTVIMQARHASCNPSGTR